MGLRSMSAEIPESMNESELSARFADRTRVFPLAKSAEARIFVQDQTGLWQRLLEEAVAPENFGTQARSQILEALRSRGDLFILTDEDDFAVARGIIPLLDEKTVSRLLVVSRASSLAFWSAIIVECAPLIG